MKKIILQMLLVVASFGFAQAQTKITGKVVDSDGNPIAFANVFVKGATNVGALTNDVGVYTVTLPAGKTTLIFSFVGYATVEQVVGNRTVINVTLKSEATEIEEMVVSGYQTVKKSTFTGAASVIKSDKLEKLPVASVDQALQGQVAGMQATTGSGQPGADTKMLIRGIGSINAGTDPLYIVDGIPITTGNLTNVAGGYNGEVSGAIANINPNDIESINVLKDASATSIYGARAANGVIVIKTKQGRRGKTKFSFSSQAGLSSRTNTGFKMVNGKEWLELGLESYLNSGKTEADFNKYMEKFPRKSNGDFYDVNWLKEAYKNNALTYQADFSAQGGDEKTSFFMSLGRYSQDAVLRWGKITRTSGRVNIEHQGTKWFKMGINATYSYTFQDIPATTAAYYINPVAGALNMSPLEPVYNEDGTFRHKMIANNGTNFVEANEYDVKEYRTHRLISNIFAEFTIIKNLRFKTLYGQDLTFMRTDQWDDPRTTGSSADNLGRATRISDEFRVSNFTNTLTYSFDINDIHNFDLLAGQEASENYDITIGGSSEGYPGFLIREPYVGAKPTEIISGREKSRLLSYFGQLNYNFDGKYYLSASVRRDGSSRFGNDNQYATFWSVGATWNIRKEKFMENFEWINNLSLRGSHGTSGNSSIKYYASKTLYAFGRYNGGGASAPSQIGDDKLGWEKQASTNLGLDYKILNNRFGGTLELYYRKTTDMLLYMPISIATGFRSRLRNVGSMRNEGIEISVNATPVATKDFTWTIDANWSRNVNKVLKIVDDKAFDSPINGRCWIEEGADIMQYKLVRYAGVNPADGAQMWYTKDGDLTFKRSYADMAVTGIGSASPKGQGGITNTFRYKGFTLSAFFYFKYGNKIFDNVAYQYMDDGNKLTGGVVHTQMKRWRKPGDITDVPKRMLSNDIQVSTRYLYDGSYIRLKNVMLGYDVPANLVKKMGLTGFRIFAQGQNLLTITKYPGMDPEVPWTGTAFYAYPTCKTWTLGIDVKF